MNRGTKEGEIEEKDFCIKFNQRHIELEKTHLFYEKDVYAVHCTQHKYSKISEKLVKPKSDSFLIKDLVQQFSTDTEYINENELVEGNYKYVVNSGVSVKNQGSKSYQISKFTFDAFMKVFNNKFLFIGVMVYCKYENELEKNYQIFQDFKISEQEFLNAFPGVPSSVSDHKEKLKFIKTQCIQKIKNFVFENNNIWNIVYSGRGVFEDPFFASYFYQDNKIIPISKLESSKISVTNGSGRSRGDYTVVFKP